jgi:hypothetical protein
MKILIDLKSENVHNKNFSIIHQYINYTNKSLKNRFILVKSKHYLFTNSIVLMSFFFIYFIYTINSNTTLLALLMLVSNEYWRTYK